MAADWIKMRGNLWDDPRVAALVDATDTSEAAVVGGLYWLWAMADQHTEDGYLPGLSLRQIDRKTGIAGLGAALEAVGWIKASPDGGIVINNFSEHNGASAKKRAQTARRVAACKSGIAQDQQIDESGNATSVTEPQDERYLEKEEEKEEAKAASLRSASSSAAPDDLPGIPAAPAEAGKGDLAERLARVTDDAIAAYNSSPLVKSNGGHLPNVSPRVGREKRQAQVKRCLRVARSICEENTGSPLVVSGFWNDYFAAVVLDDFYAGRQAGGVGHENFVPDFELLTREQTMLRIYDRTGGEAAA